MVYRNSFFLQAAGSRVSCVRGVNHVVFWSEKENIKSVEHAEVNAECLLASSKEAPSFITLLMNNRPYVYLVVALYSCLLISSLYLRLVY